MRVDEWMTPDPFTVTPWTSVRAARQLLTREQIRHLPVVQDGRVIGMLSERDLRIDREAARRLARDGASRDTDGDVRWLMSRPVRTAGPGDDLGTAADVMLTHCIGALPVVDAGGRLLGVVTTTDCLLALMRTEGPSQTLPPARGGRSARRARTDLDRGQSLASSRST